MTTSNQSKWAILVGINYYGYPKDEQLDGSVNDIHKISTFLQNVVQIPAANISMYHDFNEDDETDEDTQLRLLPTRANVLQALKRVSKDAAKGDFVYFHYSGHGDRKDTQYIHLKGSTTTFDEVFCTLDGEIRDVEFGDILDDMVSKQLVVLAVLDCCHSGGATRAGFKDEDGNLVKLRQPPNRNRSSNDDTSETNTDLAEPGTSSSWLYRDRGYNILAACQPHQKAGEYRKSEGILTHFFRETAESLHAGGSQVTYGMLQSMLNSKVERYFNSQQPMHLGESNRILFSSEIASGSSTDWANVKKKYARLGKLTLNQGEVHGVAIGDRYGIFRPGRPFLGLDDREENLLIHVRVVLVKDMESEARFVNDDQGITSYGSSGAWEAVQPGHFAKLTSRQKKATVVILPDEAHSNTIDLLRRQWKLHSNFAAQIGFDFDTVEVTKADYSVAVEKDSRTLRIRDSNTKAPENLPAISIDSLDMTEKLMQLLAHLHSFQLVADLQHPSDSVVPRHEFNLTRTVVPKERKDLVARWSLRFVNKHTEILYVTIFNLTEGYAVNKVHPKQGAASVAVDPECDIALDLGTRVPDLLIEKACRGAFAMQERFKVVITTSQTNLSHYCLEDLRNLKMRKLRDTDTLAPPAGNWFILEESVVIEVPHTYSTQAELQKQMWERKEKKGRDDEDDEEYDEFEGDEEDEEDERDVEEGKVKEEKVEEARGGKSTPDWRAPMLVLFVCISVGAYLSTA